MRKRRHLNCLERFLCFPINLEFREPCVGEASLTPQLPLLSGRVTCKRLSQRKGQLEKAMEMTQMCSRAQKRLSAGLGLEIEVNKRGRKGSGKQWVLGDEWQ